jgi:hypothetical protein
LRFRIALRGPTLGSVTVRGSRRCESPAKEFAQLCTLSAREGGGMLECHLLQPGTKSHDTVARGAVADA